MQLIPPNTHQLDCDLSAMESAIQLLNNWGQLSVEPIALSSG